MKVFLALFLCLFLWESLQIRKISGKEQVEQDLTYGLTNNKKRGIAACAYTHARAYRKNTFKLFSCSQPNI